MLCGTALTDVRAFSGWACLAGSVFSSIVMCSVSVVILNKTRHEELDEGICRENFHPVSILHSVPQQNSIPLHTLHTCLQSEPCEKHLTFLENDSSDQTKRKNFLNRPNESSSAPLNDFSYNDKLRRKKVKLVNNQTTKKENATDNPEAASKSIREREQNGNNFPRQGLVRSESGTWKHYL